MSVRAKFCNSFLGILLLFQFAGCGVTYLPYPFLPFPHKELDSPEIDGTLTQNNLPIQNALVTLSLNHTCDDPVEDTKTNTHGHFHFDSVYKVHLLAMLVPGSKLVYWSVCFSLPNGLIGARYGRFWSGVTSPVHLECEANLANERLMCKGGGDYSRLLPN